MTLLKERPWILGAIAAVLVLWLTLPVLDLSGDLRTIVTVAFWVSFVALLVVLFMLRNGTKAEGEEVQGPAFARFLFNDTRSAVFWLPIRLYLGLEWLDAGLHKFGDPAWTGGGSALRAYWERAAAIPEAPARPPIAYDWYRDFINILLNANAEPWFAWLITLGEIAVGIGLILGILTGIAAFFGAFMNMSFLLAGSASTNPVLFTFAIGLILAWKVAGHIGVDRYLLPRLGTPWEPGTIANRMKRASAATG